MSSEEGRRHPERRKEVIPVEEIGDDSKDCSAEAGELYSLPGGNAIEYSKPETSGETWSIGFLDMKVTECRQLDYLCSNRNLKSRISEGSFQKSSSNVLLRYVTALLIIICISSMVSCF